MTQEQIARAREVDALDYILTREPGNVRRVGSGYRLKDHESLAVSDKGFYWHSKGIGGRTALDFLVDVRGYSLVDAVCLLLGESAVTRTGKTSARRGSKRSDATRLARRPFALPPRHKDNRRVIAYLQSRGIDRELIMNCIKHGILYESAPHHNCVFTGRDENGRTRCAAIRATTSGFKRDADGSEKRYGFVLPPDDSARNAVAVFESPIDALSHQTLCKQGFIAPFDGWRLSLGGTGIIALEHFIKQRPEVTHCLICTDNDEAGEMAAAKIAGLRGISSTRAPPLAGNDWNDALVALQKAERTQNRSRNNDNLIL